MSQRTTCADDSALQMDSIKDVFKDKFLLKLTMIQIYSWFVNGCSYYGITLAAGHQSHQSLYWGTAMYVDKIF